MQKLIDNKGMEYLGNIHGGPFVGNDQTDFCPERREMFCCLHNELGFLPWHRLYMTQMEDSLEMALPYWDWTEEGQGQIPDLWEGLAPTFKSPVTSVCQTPNECACKRGDGTGRFVNRKENVRINPPIGNIKIAFDFFDNFIEFEQPPLKSPHDDVHGTIGCEMTREETAGYDPIFFLHHTFVDYLWAFWQEVQQIREALL